MELVKKLSERWKGVDYPFLIHVNGELAFSDIQSQKMVDLDERTIYPHDTKNHKLFLIPLQLSS